MSSETKITEQQLFDQLISSLVHSAWVFMGKIKNPINDKLERDLDQASIQIDMLDMLFKRMSGNLSENEDQYLGHLIRELKMNFVEEKNKKTEESVEDGKGEKLKHDENPDLSGKDSSNVKEESSKEAENKSNDEAEKNVEEKQNKESKNTNEGEAENSEEKE